MHHRRLYAAALFAALLLTTPPAFAQDVVPSVHHDYRVETVVDGLVPVGR